MILRIVVAAIAVILMALAGLPSQSPVDARLAAATYRIGVPAILVPAAGDRLVYAGGLQPGWVDRSWWAALAVEPDALSFTPTQGYGSLFLTTSTPVTGLGALRITAKATGTDQRYSLIAFNTDGIAYAAGVPLEGYGGLSTTAFRTIDVPLTHLGTGGGAVSGIAITEARGVVVPALRISDIRFIGTAPSVAAPAFPTVTPVPRPAIPSVGAAVPGNPFLGSALHALPVNSYLQAADQIRASRPDDAAILDKLGKTPIGQWFGDWNTDVRRDVDARLAEATLSGGLPVFVMYNLPIRDCGGYSGNGDVTPDQYRAFVRSFAAGLAGRRVVVILEPDGFETMKCLSAEDSATRLTLMREAVDVLTALPGVSLYIEASFWIPADRVASLLQQVGIAKARGFALNVAHYQTTPAIIEAGRDISARVGGKPFIIDTSRNGAGLTPDGQWCNPPARAVGMPPGTPPTDPLVDANVWLKVPGESDGACNGGPVAGSLWVASALDLARRAGWTPR